MEKTNLKIEHKGRVIDADFYRPKDRDCFPIVILSHGYNGHKSDFEISAEYFAVNGIGAVCYTFCGGSTRDVSGFPTTEMTLFTEKEDLLAVIAEVKTWDCLQEGQLFLFGGSQGGMVSALTAEECEEEIQALILLYPALCIADNWNERFKSVEEIPDKEELWGMTLGRRFFEAIRDFKLEERIGRFSKPVLIMHGVKDDVVPISYGEWAARTYTNATLEVFEEEGHGFTDAGNRRMEAMALYFIHRCQ